MKVLVTGDFGKIHSGHLEHIRQAYDLGDWLIIGTHPDDDIKKRKGYEPDPASLRIELLNIFIDGLGGQGSVVMCPDTDGKSVKALELFRPDIFAKGGGYTLGTMPYEEVETCLGLGIRIVFGVGERLGQSRDYALSPGHPPK